MKEFTPHPFLESACNASADTIAVAISGRDVLVKNECGRISLPLLKELPYGSVDAEKGIIIGKSESRTCAGFTFSGTECGELQLIDLRRAFTIVSRSGCTALCRAKSLLEWKKRKNYFC